jgi:ribosome-interacting GTPase 1
MVNYENSKVYKIEPIVEHPEEDIYIGSTTKKYLSQRMDTHRNGFKCWKNGKYHKFTVYDLFDKYGVENCKIYLLETINCNTKDELLAREGHYIKTLKCVNRCITGRTMKNGIMKINKKY